LITGSGAEDMNEKKTADHIRIYNNDRNIAVGVILDINS
jgi:hypothetical protein